jgi:hypothetical protein
MHFPILWRQPSARLRDDIHDTIIIDIAAIDLLSVVQADRPQSVNSDEANLTNMIIYNAVSFWRQLLERNGIKSTIVISVRTLAPSLLDTDIVV